MGFTLPGGFSPTQALKQVGDWAGVYGDNRQGADYDVFSKRSFDGGARDPAPGTGGFWGGNQGAVNPGWVQTPTGGYVIRASTQGAGNNPAGGGGGGGGGGGSAPADPYARWGGRAAFDSQRGAFVNKSGDYREEASSSLRDKGNTYDQTTRDWLNSVEDTQGGLNRRSGQNALNLRTSMANIVRGIQDGIKSGNVMLAGMNALSSSAAEAIARAYAKVGNRQTGEARGQAAQEDEAIALEQANLGRTIADKSKDLDTYRDTELGRVRSDFSSKLRGIQDQANAGGYGSVVDMNMVDQVLGEAMQRMAAIDASRQQRLGGIKAWTPEQIMQEAIRMENAGQAGNAFSVDGADVNYNSGGAPTNGAPVSNLPIYLKNKDQLSVPGSVRRRD